MTSLRRTPWETFQVILSLKDPEIISYANNHPVCVLEISFHFLLGVMVLEPSSKLSILRRHHHFVSDGIVLPPLSFGKRVRHFGSRSQLLRFKNPIVKPVIA